MYYTTVSDRHCGKRRALILYAIKYLKEYKAEHNDKPIMIDWDFDRDCGFWYERTENELIKRLMPECLELKDVAMITKAVNHGATEEQIYEYLKGM